MVVERLLVLYFRAMVWKDLKTKMFFRKIDFKSFLSNENKLFYRSIWSCRSFSCQKLQKHLKTKRKYFLNQRKLFKTTKKKKKYRKKQTGQGPFQTPWYLLIQSVLAAFKLHPSEKQIEIKLELKIEWINFGFAKNKNEFFRFFLKEFVLIE